MTTRSNRSPAPTGQVAPALHKMMEDDPMIRFFRDPQTNEFLVAGAGQPHIEALVSNWRGATTPTCAEGAEGALPRDGAGTCRGTGRTEADRSHGQFGDCKLRIEPMPRGSGFVFANEIFGGSIPRQYVPAVEKEPRFRRIPKRRAATSFPR